MDFSLAFKVLKKGSRIRREIWKNPCYIKLETLEINGEIKHYIKYFSQQAFRFQLSAELMISDKWKIDGKEGLFEFEEALDHLKKRGRVRIDYFSDDEWLELDSDRTFMIKKMVSSSYDLIYEDFYAMDWEILT